MPAALYALANVGYDDTEGPASHYTLANVGYDDADGPATHYALANVDGALTPCPFITNDQLIATRGDTLIIRGWGLADDTSPDPNGFDTEARWTLTPVRSPHSAWQVIDWEHSTSTGDTLTVQVPLGAANGLIHAAHTDGPIPCDGSQWVPFVALDPANFRPPASEWQVDLFVADLNPSGPPTFTRVDPIPFSSLKVEENLRYAGAATITAPIHGLTPSAKAALLDIANLVEVRIVRTRDPVVRTVFRGRIIRTQPDAKSGIIKIEAIDLLGYLRYGEMETSLQEFHLVDQALIAKAIIDDTQGQLGGHYGLDTSTIGPVGVPRERTYVDTERNNALERLLQLSDVQRGFDISVDPETRQVNIWFPQRGQDLTPFIRFTENLAMEMRASFSVAPGDIATDAKAITSGVDPLPPAWATNTELRARSGRSVLVETFDGITAPATLQDHANRMTQRYGNVLVTASALLRPLVGHDWFDFGLGDTVGWSADQGLGRVSIERRVTGRSVAVDETGDERMTVELSDRPDPGDLAKRIGRIENGLGTLKGVMAPRTRQ